MDRVVVVGGPGSGKTTFARCVAGATGAEHVELDSLWWQRDWVHLRSEELQEVVSRLLDKLERWVVDGNYLDEVGDIVWARADTVVWLDLRRRTAFRRAVSRSVRRVVTRRSLWNGNREQWGVLSPRSLHRLWTRWPTYSANIDARIHERRQDVEVVRLTSVGEVRRWLAPFDDQ